MIIPGNKRMTTTSKTIIVVTTTLITIENIDNNVTKSTIEIR